MVSPFRLNYQQGYHSDHNQRLLITKINQNILICTISMSDLFTQPKMSGVCIRSNLHNALKVFPFNLMCNMTYLRKKGFDPIWGLWMYKRAEYWLALCSLHHSCLIRHVKWLLTENKINYLLIPRVQGCV